MPIMQVNGDLRLAAAGSVRRQVIPEADDHRVAIVVTKRRGRVYAVEPPDIGRQIVGVEAMGRGPGHYTIFLFGQELPPTLMGSAGGLAPADVGVLGRSGKQCRRVQRGRNRKSVDKWPGRRTDYAEVA